MKRLTKNKKNRLLVFLCCAVLTAGLLTGCGGADGTGGSGGSGGDTDQNPGKASETARTIVVQETNGTTIVLDEAKVSTNAYKGMHLFSGNDVTVQEISDLTMLLDMDKYLYAEESTHFWLEATGTQENSQTTIYLEEGAELNRIVNPLEEGSVYQVHTPNSTMAVRGTVFRMEVRKGKDNKVYTDLAVLDGSVEVKLKTTTGEYNGVEETIDAGQAASIQADEETSEFITDENGNITTPVDYTSFPSGTVEKIIEYIDDGEEIAADKEELEKVAEDLKAQEEEQKKEEQEEEQKEEEHEHEWKTVTVRQADCTKEGLSQAVCSVCGETGEQQTIPVTAHKASAKWTTEKEATCTEEGTQVKTCSVCGEVLESRQVSKTAHKPGEEQTIDATCTEPGSVSVVCLFCGHTVEEHLLEALGHQPGNWVVIQPANYGVEGSQSQFCTVCGQLLGTQSIPALIPEPVPEPEACKHEVKEWEETPADCTTAGSRTGTCSLCNEEVSETISALGHAPEEDWTETTAPTCTETGIHVKYCTRCKEIVASEDIGALGHKWSDWEETPATCTVDGSKTRTCTRDNCEVSETVKTVEKLGHKLTEVEAQAATCTEAGVEAYWTCSTCKANFSDAEGMRAIANLESWKTGDGKITAAGHSLADVDLIAATCTTDGVQAHKHCSDCNKNFIDGIEKTAEQLKIPARHTLIDVARVEATCTEAGVKTYKHCTACSKNFLDASGETEITDFNAWKTGDGKITATGHSLADVDLIAATCTTDGVQAHKHCSDCNKNFIDGIEKTDEQLKIPAAHTKTSVSREATCTEAGVREYWNCSACGKNFADVACETEITDLNAWKDGDGKITAKGHNLSDVNLVAATCTTDGVQAHKHCSDCNKNFIDGIEKTAEQLKIPAAHTKTSVSREATCTEAGVREYWNCSACGKNFADVACQTEITDIDAWKEGTGKIDATGHSLEKTNAKAETCTATGNHEYWTCTKCQKIFSDELGTNETRLEDCVIAKKAHQVSNWTVLKPASDCMANPLVNGQREGTCSSCNNIITETIFPTHTITTRTTEPTCTEPGMIITYCSKCNTEFSRETTTPKLGHEETWVVDETKEQKVVDEEGNVWEVTENKICERCHTV